MKTRKLIDRFGDEISVVMTETSKSRSVDFYLLDKQIKNSITNPGRYIFGTRGYMFESPYLSWRNLYHAFSGYQDEAYLETAVQEGKKLFAQCVMTMKTDRPTYGKAFSDEEAAEYMQNLKSSMPENCECGFIPHKCDKDFKRYYICREGKLSAYFNLDAVFERYHQLGVELSEEERRNVREMANNEISVFATKDAPFDFLCLNCALDTEWIVNGLLLGYPIESTVSVLNGTNK